MERRTTPSSLIAVLIVAASLVAISQTASATGPPSVSAESYPVIQGEAAPLGDIAVTEDSAGRLTVGDVITFRLRDASNAATIHLASPPSVSGTHGLAATAAISSSSGALKDQVTVTISAASTGAFPGTLTMTALNADIDLAATTGSDQVQVWDAASIIAPVATPVIVTNAEAIGAAPAATYSESIRPGIDTTGVNQHAGDLIIAEPSKIFFKTGDQITFTVRDSLGTRDTVGLASAPVASGGAMIVHVTGLTGGPVEPNDTGFKVVIDQQTPSNGSATKIKVSNIVFNTADAPVGRVAITAKVTAGSAAEYIYPGRVYAALVGGGTTTTSVGKPIVQMGATAQDAANIQVNEIAGTLKPSTTFSLQIQEPGVTFNAAPVAVVTAGNLQLQATGATLGVANTTATWTVAAQSTKPSTITIAPISYAVAASGPGAGDPVDVLASGGVGSNFTPETVANARIAPAATALFTAAGAPNTPTTAGDVVYQEVPGQRAPTGGSLVLLSPNRTALLAGRVTFNSLPTATITPGSGLVLGPGSINASALVVTTTIGKVNVPAETAAVYPVTTGSASDTTVTFSGISYSVGSLVPPGALVATGAVTTGAGGSGTSVSGNDFVNALNPVPPNWGLPSPSPSPSPSPPPAVFKPDAMLKLSTGATFVGDGIYGTALGQTVSATVKPGASATFVIQVQNDGNVADSFKVTAVGSQPPFTAKFLDGDTGSADITAQVTGGTYTTGSLVPGSSATLRLKVTAKKTATSGSRKGWSVDVASVADPTKTDLVKAKARVS